MRGGNPGSNGGNRADIGAFEAALNRINGTMFLDRNRNGIFDKNEAALPNVDVFLDQNKNGLLSRSSHSIELAVKLAPADPTRPDIGGIGISGNGKILVFATYDNNLVADDRNNTTDVYAFDHDSRKIQRISKPLGSGDSNSLSEYPSVSRLGDYIAFSSSASNLVPNDTNRLEDAYVANRLTGAVERVSAPLTGFTGNFFIDGVKYPSM